MTPKHTDTELLPCPFCARSLTNIFAGSWSHPNIPTDCPAQFIVIRASDTKAITAWNTRASPTSDHNPLTVKDMRHSDVVERVADALGMAFYGKHWWRNHGARYGVYVDQMRLLAKAALEACHHVELMEAVRISAQAFRTLEEVAVANLEHDKARNFIKLGDKCRDTLAKIGGEA